MAKRKGRTLVPLTSDYQMPTGFTEIPSGTFWAPSKTGDSMTGRWVGFQTKKIQGKDALSGVLVVNGQTMSLPSHKLLNDQLQTADASKGPDGVEVHVVYLGEREANTLSGFVAVYAVGYRPLG